jgi:hypothetical protein
MRPARRGYRRRRGSARDWMVSGGRAQSARARIEGEDGLRPAAQPNPRERVGTRRRDVSPNAACADRCWVGGLLGGYHARAIGLREEDARSLTAAHNIEDTVAPLLRC